MIVDSGFAPLVAGVLAGAVLGFVARRQHFCTMGSFERHWYAGDSSGLRTWAVAILSAIVFTEILIRLALFNPADSFYTTVSFGWTGAILGGLAFGFGMALVGTCGFGALVRLGGGSLRGLIVVLVLGLSALAAQRGVVGLGRIAIVDDAAFDLGRIGAPDQTLPGLVQGMTGLDLRLPIVVAVCLALALWIGRDAVFRRDVGRIATGVLIGAVIAFGWAATSAIADASFQPVRIESASFVVPPGELILHAITYTGALPSYGVGVTLGVVLGAAMAAMLRHEVRWEACDDARELSRHLLGAVLMGVGGVFSLGCTIGQGISAASLLTISAPLVLVSIAIGARLGLAYLFEGSIRHAFTKPERSPAE